MAAELTSRVWEGAALLSTRSTLSPKENSSHPHHWPGREVSLGEAPVFTVIKSHDVSKLLEALASYLR